MNWISLFPAIFYMSIACSEDKENSETTETQVSEPSEDVNFEPALSFAYYTQGIEGEATVVSGISFEGTEAIVRGINETAGTGNIDYELVWNLSGIAIEMPSECGNCQFSFEIQATFDAEASTDPYGEGRNAAFSYAFGDSNYGTSLFYYADESWLPWIVHGQSMRDLADKDYVEIASLEGTSFTYSDRKVDFYYYY